MRIGILTLPPYTNYGGILQAYALQTILERMGHRIALFNHAIPKSHPRFKYLTYFIRAIRHYLLRQNIYLFTERDDYNRFYHYRKHTQRFIDTYIHSYQLPNLDFSKVAQKDFDAIIVGSDQIWRGKEIDNLLSKTDKAIAYLSFAEHWNIKRIAYAVSFGTDDWEYTKEETARCAKFAQLFSAISVRESSGIRLAEERLGVRAFHVLDPTMLLDKDDYIQLVEKNQMPRSTGSLLCYILDETEDKSTAINIISKRLHLRPFSVNTFEDDAPSSVEKWLRGFMDAEYVMTDSFHACVFSIIFNKPFIVYGNKVRGMARFESLLNIFGLQDRLIYTSSDLEAITYEVNFNYANHKLIEHKQISLQFLHEALSK